MDLGIKGRVSLVAASSRGLGLATALELAGEGCHVAICSRDKERLEVARQRLESVKPPQSKTVAHQIDLTDGEGIETMVSEIVNELGPIDILVTNCGGPPPGTFEGIEENGWNKGFELTFLSAVHLIRSVLSGMKERGWGRIVNITSRSVRDPIPNLILSNSMRLAVVGMAKTLAGEVARFGITVNSVCPGTTRTERAVELARLRAEQKGISVEEELHETGQKIPIGRLVEPWELAAAVAFLASERASAITGESLLVDGGFVTAI